jgi:autophagy-related protein 11
MATVAASQPKALATTALTEQAVASSASSNDGSPFESPVTPSPEQSLPDVAGHRRRTTSYHNPRPSPLASSSSQSTVVPSKPASTASDTLATLANSWGMPFGRKKKSELGNLATAVEFPVDDARGNAQRHTTHTISAHDLLKRL